MAIQVSIIRSGYSEERFQVHGVDRRGEVVLRKRLRRGQVREFFSQQELCLVGMDATRSAYYWARVIEQARHISRPPAQPPCAEPDQMLGDVLRELVKELGI